MRRTSWPDDDRDALVPKEPPKGQGRRVAAPHERLECVVDTIVAEVLVRPRAQSHPRALRSRRVPSILPGQPAAHQRTVRLEPGVVHPAERDHRLCFTIEQRVRVLDGGDGADRKRLSQLRAVDVAETVGADFPGRDELVESADRLGDWHVRVPRVREVEVDPLHAEPLEARVDLPPNPSRSETAILSFGNRVEGLGRDPKSVRLPRANPLADVRLTT